MPVSKKQLETEWQKILARHAQHQPFAGRYGKPVKSIATPKAFPQPAPKPMTYTPHGGTAKPRQQYTGTAILGIGTLHKSNAVPVFSQEEAIDMAKMRRGG